MQHLIERIPAGFPFGDHDKRMREKFESLGYWFIEANTSNVLDFREGTRPC